MMDSFMKNVRTCLTEYFCSTEPFASRKRSIATMTILLLWIAAVIFISTRHELWRDEVRALSIALAPDSIWQLPTVVRNEGHPLLWYLLLRLGHFLLHTPLILPIASILTAFGGVCILFRYAPFPLWQKILFLAGVLPSYEYSVVTRNYGISMLLFFLFAALYPKKSERPLCLAFVLAALANSNAHSCILAALLTALWFWDDVVAGRHLLSRRKISYLAVALVIIGGGIVSAVAISFPSPETSVTGVHSLTASEVLNAFWANIRHPGENYPNLFAEMGILFRDLLLWLLVAGLLIRPFAAALLLTGTVLLGTFFSVVYMGFLRHEGIVLIFAISLYWIVSEQLRSQARIEQRKTFNLLNKISVNFVLSAVLAIQLLLSATSIKADIVNEMSSSKGFGKFLKTSPYFREALIVGEPDYLLESLSYYASNRIYIPREGKWRNHVMFTRANKERLSLGELLNVARQIRYYERKPVLIALGHFDLDMTGGEIAYSYNKIFSWSSAELADFRNGTVKVTEFKSAETDENYEIYLLR